MRRGRGGERLEGPREAPRQTRGYVIAILLVHVANEVNDSHRVIQYFQFDLNVSQQP